MSKQFIKGTNSDICVSRRPLSNEKTTPIRSPEMCQPAAGHVVVAVAVPDDDAQPAPRQARLRPHLLPEIFDILIKSNHATAVQPMVICKFVMASKESLLCIFNLLRYRFNRIYHQGCRMDRSIMLSDKKNESIMFTEELHVKVLLRFAGACMHEIQNCIGKTEWLEPFFDGLRENTCLTALNTCAGNSVFDVYSESHDTFPPVFTNAFHLAHIDMYRRQDHFDVARMDRAKAKKLEELVIMGDMRTAKHLMPVLDIPLKCVKNLTCKARLRYYGALRILRYFDATTNITMNDVVFPKPRAMISLDRTLEITKLNFDMMWKAMQKHHASITIMGSQEGYKRCPHDDAHNLITSFFSDCIVESSIASKSCCFSFVLKRGNAAKSLTLGLIIHWC